MNPMAALQAMAAGGTGAGPAEQAQMMQMLMGMMRGQGGAGGASAAEEEDDDGRQVRVADLTALKASVAAHPALKWDLRMGKLAGEEGIVKTDDPSDGTTYVRFPPPVGVVAWLPTDALSDL